MLTSPAALRDKLAELDVDIGLLPGRRVALLGFRDPSATRVAENVRVLQSAAGWTAVDLRLPIEGPIRQVLGKALDAPKLALILDTTKAPPTDALLLIRALRDSNNFVRWVDGAETPLPADRILYVIASGAREWNDLPRELQRIDFMTFIKAPS
jgi:hypothetical protein